MKTITNNATQMISNLNNTVKLTNDTASGTNTALALNLNYLLKIKQDKLAIDCVVSLLYVKFQ